VVDVLPFRDAYGTGGFLGYAARDARRVQGEVQKKISFNVGLNDTFLVLPPFRPNHGWFFKETYFRVCSPFCCVITLSFP